MFSNSLYWIKLSKLSKVIIYSEYIGKLYIYFFIQEGIMCHSFEDSNAEK